MPLKGNEAKVNQNFTLEERRRAAVEMAQQSHEPVTTRVVELSRGGLGFIIYVPIYTGTNFDGWIAGVFKAQPLFDRYLPAPVAPGYAVTISDGAETFYERYPSPQPSNKDWIFSSSIDQRGASWNVRIWPTPALIAQMDSSLPETVLLAGPGASRRCWDSLFTWRKSRPRRRGKPQPSTANWRKQWLMCAP